MIINKREMLKLAASGIGLAFVPGFLKAEEIEEINIAECVLSYLVKINDVWLMDPQEISFDQPSMDYKILKLRSKYSDMLHRLAQQVDRLHVVEIIAFLHSDEGELISEQTIYLKEIELIGSMIHLDHIDMQFNDRPENILIGHQRRLL